jgi:hypothetical protein
MEENSQNNLNNSNNNTNDVLVQARLRPPAFGILVSSYHGFPKKHYVPRLNLLVNFMLASNC